METQNIMETVANAVATGPGEYPRVTLTAIEAEIVHEHYFTAAEGLLGYSVNNNTSIKVPEELELLTFCVLTLRNGFTVTGQSACADARNFNADIGRSVARADAIRQVWPLLGFVLRDTLHQLATLGGLGNEQDAIGEALTRMTAHRLGNADAFRVQDAEVILGHFTKSHTTEPLD